MNNLEMNSESIVLGNYVVTKFSTNNNQSLGGLRICKIAWFENKIGRSSSSLLKITTGSRIYDNLIISDLSEGKITYEEVMTYWMRGKISDIVHKYKDLFKVYS